MSIASDSRKAKKIIKMSSNVTLFGLLDVTSCYLTLQMHYICPSTLKANSRKRSGFVPPGQENTLNIDIKGDL
ncbi:hypothetical protein BS333_18320 [Vibrio azureus]|nr:hypothetical protein BS333_18320 [Vibrio azureus]